MFWEYDSLPAGADDLQSWLWAALILCVGHCQLPQLRQLQLRVVWYVWSVWIAMACVWCVFHDQSSSHSFDLRPDCSADAGDVETCWILDRVCAGDV